MLFTTGQFSEGEQRTISFKRLFRRIFIDDWPMKVVALVITLALWFNMEAGKATFTVPLKLGISDNAEFITPPVQEVEVVLRGDKAKIDELSSRRNDLVVFRNLTEEPIGDRVIDLTRDTVSIDLPPGVRISEIRPSKIIIKLEAVIEKEVPVRAENGRLPESSEVYGETVTPQKVRVRGPASYIKTLEFVSTEKISLENKTSDFTARQVAVTVSNPKARILDAVVDVAFHIDEKRGERLVTAAVKDAAGKKIPVNIYGPVSLLKGIKPGELKVEMVDDEAGRKVPQFVDLPAELQGRIEIRRETKAP